MPDDLSVQTSCSSCSVKVASESFVGKVLDLHTNLLLGKWLRSSESVVRRALFACFSSFVCPVASLQLSIGKLKILGTASFLNASRRDSKESTKTPYQKILVEAVFREEFCINSRMLRGRKAFSFYLYKPFSFKFWIDSG